MKPERITLAGVVPTYVVGANYDPPPTVPDGFEEFSFELATATCRNEAPPSLALGLLTFFWYLRGVLYYGRDEFGWALAVPLAPLVTVVGILDPPGESRVTKKSGGS